MKETVQTATTHTHRHIYRSHTVRSFFGTAQKKGERDCCVAATSGRGTCCWSMMREALVSESANLSPARIGGEILKNLQPPVVVPSPSPSLFIVYALQTVSRTTNHFHEGPRKSKPESRARERERDSEREWRRCTGKIKLKISIIYGKK